MDLPNFQFEDLYLFFWGIFRFGFPLGGGEGSEEESEGEKYQ